MAVLNTTRWPGRQCLFCPSLTGCTFRRVQIPAWYQLPEFEPQLHVSTMSTLFPLLKLNEIPVSDFVRTSLLRLKIKTGREVRIGRNHLTFRY